MELLKHEMTRRRLTAREEFFQAWPHGAFAFGIAGAVDVRGIGHQQQDAALAVFGEGVQVEEFVIGGRGVDFEIAGVDHDAKRRGDGQRDATHNGVGDADEFDVERARA